MQDTAYFHALMAYIGSIRDEMAGRVTTAEVLFHNLEAIKLVNKRISSGQFDDATIGAINLLWTQAV
jgi:hypothetical protein